MMDPPPSATIRSPTRADNRNGPFRLRLTTESNNFSVTEPSDSYSGDMPALLIRTSTLPNRSYAAATKPSSSSQCPTCTWYGNAARPVAASISLVVSTHDSYLRLAMITSAPQCAAAKAISRPSPRLPPVTSTTRSVRSKSSSAYPMSMTSHLGLDVCCLADYPVNETQLADHWWRNHKRIQWILAHRGVDAIEEQRQPCPVVKQTLDGRVVVALQRGDVPWHREPHLIGMQDQASLTNGVDRVSDVEVVREAFREVLPRMHGGVLGDEGLGPAFGWAELVVPADLGLVVG